MKKRTKISITLIAVALSVLAIGFWIYKDYIFEPQTFYNNIKINGVNVGGMTPSEASNVLEANFLANRDDIQIDMEFLGENLTINGTDFEVTENMPHLVQKVFLNTSQGGAVQRRANVKKISQTGAVIPVSSMLAGFDQKLAEIFGVLNRPVIEPYAVFTPEDSQPFEYFDGQEGVVADLDLLKQEIDQQFMLNNKISVKVPYSVIKPEKTLEQIKEQTSLRASFSTSYSSSTSDRKFNVKKALSSFNGMVIQPEDEVSFNQTTGPRSGENGYKNANIILNGVYVEGSGGGVCQASTTLYNALLYADLEVLEVHKHSLPVAYVPLAFDAMVSEGISDLKFKNSTEYPIYIKTWGDNSNAYVEIYGLKFPDGFKIERKAEFIKVIPHQGDKIVEDVNGEYSDKVTFKGEYLRIKYPREGYESNAYIVKYMDGIVLEEKLIRHEVYQPQQGVIIEGTEDVYDGITLPENTVKFIPPQKDVNSNADNVGKKIENTNPAKFNP